MPQTKHSLRLEMARYGLLLTTIFWTAETTSSCAANEPRIPDNVVVTYHLAYREGSSASWKLDLAMPKEPAKTPRPAIVAIHGGGWIEGGRSSFSQAPGGRPGHIIDFAKLGFVAVSIDYRLAKEAPFPAAIQDCQCAVRWLRANRDKYQIDPERIGVWGNSAGGHLALMLGMLDRPIGPEADAPHPDQSGRVQAIVSDSGSRPIDLVHQHQHRQVHTAIEMFMGGPPVGTRLLDYQHASPSHHITAKLPPTLLIYGAADAQVGVETADRFVEALREAGAKDINYLRLGTTDHCPYSLIRVPWLVPAVNEFFLRMLKTR